MDNGKLSNNRVNAPQIQKTREKFLFVCLNLVEQWSKGDLKRTDVAKRLGAYSSWKRPEQSLQYHLNRFMKDGLVRKVQSYPYSTYELTSKGQRIQKILIQSQDVRALWRCHHLIVGFAINSYGNFRFVNTSKRKIVNMNNWQYALEKIGDFSVWVQNTGLLKIYCPPKYSQEPDAAFAKMYSEATRTAQHYVDSYGMVLKPMRIIRKGHKALVRSESLAKMLGKFNIDGKVWVDESEGMEIEELQDSYAIDGLLKVPQEIAQLQQQIRGYTTQQLANSNTLLLLASVSKTQTKILERIEMLLYGRKK